jgi:hypothetical protein
MIGSTAQAQGALVEPGEILVAGKMLALEFLLAAACCRWPRANERASVIRAAARDISDWDRFLRVVKHHRVIVQVQQGLEAAAIELPPGVVEELNRLAQDNVRRGLKCISRNSI